MLESKDLVAGGEVEVVSKDLMLVFSEGILDATRLMNSGLNGGGGDEVVDGDFWNGSLLPWSLSSIITCSILSGSMCMGGADLFGSIILSWPLPFWIDWMNAGLNGGGRSSEWLLSSSHLWLPFMATMCGHVDVILSLH